MAKNLIIFASGLAIGAGATFVFLREKYNNDMQREIDQYKEDVKAREAAKEESAEDDIQPVSVDDPEEARAKAKFNMNKPPIETISAMKDIIKKQNYVSFSKPDEEEKEEEVMQEPYIISSDRFINDRKYMNETITYYEINDILADAADQEMDIDKTIGRDALNHFGEGAEEGVVYVRNEVLQMDYEVICSQSDFDELVGLDDEEEDY